MRAHPYLAVGLLLACACETAGPTRPAPVAAPAPEAVGSIEDQVRTLAEKSRPSAMHEHLAPLVGEWDVTLASLDAQGRETQTFSGRATIAKVLGGRFLRWELRVDFGNTPATSLWYLGYDQPNAVYELLMMSDLATGMAVATGTGDLAGDGVPFVWERFDPRTGTRPQAKARLRVQLHDRFVLEQLESRTGSPERPTRVWTYRRAAPSPAPVKR